MRYVVVLPFMVQHFRDACVATMHPEYRDNVVEVDNTVENLGVMRSHNLGIDAMRERDADWLVVNSAAIRWAPDTGGLDFVQALETICAESHVVNAVGVYGWHCIAFSRETIEAVGRWDENFSPYGFDDNDLSIRIHKALPDAAWSGVTVGVSDTIMGHSIKVGGLDSPAPPRIAYFTEKWGRGCDGSAFELYYDTPWNDPANDIGYWPPPDGSFPPVEGALWDQPA